MNRQLIACKCVLVVSFALTAATSMAAPPEKPEPNQEDNINPLLREESLEPGFFEGSTLQLKPRTYYLNRDRESRPDNIGWALGGALEYRTGWWKNSLRVGATLFTSQKLYGPEENDGTLLFKPGPESFTVLGEAFVTYRFAENQGVRLGRQRFELPYLGSHDIRMVPNTFEAVAVGNISETGFAYMAGYVDQIKRKNDDEFIAMSQAAGAEDSDEGLGFAGARYIRESGGEVAAIYQHTFETFDTLYATVKQPFNLGDNTALKTFLQYTRQGSVGEALIGDFNTSMIAAKLELQTGDITWRAAASKTDDELGIQKPYGNPANYLSVIVDDFDRAGETALLAGISYNFNRIGPGDLSGFANIVRGDTPETGAAASADETEYDLTFDYRIREGWGENLWLRVRGAYIEQDDDFAGSDDFFDFRIIVNYNYDIL